MTELFYTILNMSISASVLVLVVLLLRLIFRKAPKWVAVLLWGLVAIRLICPFALETPFSLMPRAEWVTEETSYTEGNQYFDSVPPDRISVDSILDSEIGKDITFRYYPIEPQIEINRGVNPAFVLNCIWFAGIAGMLAYMLISYICVMRRIRGAVKFRDNIYTSESVSSPFVFGLIRPCIYLPENLDAVSMSYVIAHEEAHLRRHDHLWKPFGFLLLAVHWFNPLIWIGYILLCRDIEMACDERVVRGMNDEERVDYSEALLECSVKPSTMHRTMITACPLSFGEVGAKQRIKSVLNYKKPTFWIVAVAVIACAVTAICFLTNPGSFHFHGSVGAGLRFPSSDPSAAELCDISINGQIIRDEFKGTLSVDGRQMNVSILMDRDISTIGYYVGPRREIYGILLVFDDKLTRFALKTNDTSEYILYGMTVEEFEWEMKHRNYYVDYLHDVVLHDITVSDKAHIISDIHTEGRTVIIYGMDLDTDEINRTFYSGDDVMGTLEYLPSEDMRVFYACASTCLNGKVYVGYYHVNYPADGDKADLIALLEKQYLTESTLLNVGYDFRNKKLEMHAAETDPIVKSMPSIDDYDWYFERAYTDNREKNEYQEWYQPGFQPKTENANQLQGILVSGDESMWYDFITGERWYTDRTGLHFIHEKTDSRNAHYTVEIYRDTGELIQGADAVMEPLTDNDGYVLTVYYTRDGYENRLIFTTKKPPETGMDKKPLTLEDVVTLSAKGTDLTWEDFAGYKSIETGSGLYIRVYVIDENFSLWIGGGSPVSTPMYIRLKCNDVNIYADVTTDDIAAFIEKHTKEGPILYDRPLSYYIDLAWAEAEPIAKAKGYGVQKTDRIVTHDSTNKTITVIFSDSTLYVENWSEIHVTLLPQSDGSYAVDSSLTTATSEAELQAEIDSSIEAARYEAAISRALKQHYHDDEPTGL